MTAAFADFLDDPGHDGAEIVRIAAGGDAVADHHFLVDPFCPGVFDILADRFVGDGGPTLQGIGPEQVRQSLTIDLVALYAAVGEGWSVENVYADKGRGQELFALSQPEQRVRTRVAISRTLQRPRGRRSGCSAHYARAEAG